MSHIEKYYKELLLCYKCGNCQAFCPNFSKLRDESAVARGLISLIEAKNDGIIGFSDRFVELLYQCIGCWQCVDNCPSGVRFDKILLAMRADYMQSANSEYIKQKIARNVKKIPHPIRNFLSKILPQLPPQSITRQIFNELNLKNQSDMPTLIRGYDQVFRPIHKPKMRIGFFVGCTGNYIYPQIAKSSIELLLENDIEIVIAKNQTCCGRFSLDLGDFVSAREFVDKNIKAFSEFDLDGLVVLCKSGRWMLKEGLGVIFDNDVYLHKKIYSITDLLPNVQISEELLSIDCPISALLNLL